MRRRYRFIIDSQTQPVLQPRPQDQIIVTRLVALAVGLFCGLLGAVLEMAIFQARTQALLAALLMPPWALLVRWIVLR